MFKSGPEQKMIINERIGKKQEFGSMQPRFGGLVEINREKIKHLGPGCYDTEIETSQNRKLKLNLKND